jgi:hypothetical protein
MAEQNLYGPQISGASADEDAIVAPDFGRNPLAPEFLLMAACLCQVPGCRQQANSAFCIGVD